MDQIAKFISAKGRVKCKCDVCRSHASIKAIIRRGDKKEMRACIHSLSESLCNTREELDMANAYIADLRGEAK